MKTLTGVPIIVPLWFKIAPSRGHSMSFVDVDVVRVGRYALEITQLVHAIDGPRPEPFDPAKTVPIDVPVPEPIDVPPPEPNDVPPPEPRDVPPGKPRPERRDPTAPKPRPIP
jgi:hypothetical protein